MDWLKSHFLEQHNHSKNKVEVELDLSHYATGVYTSGLPKKDELAGFKSDVDELDIDKLPSNSSNLKSKLDKLDFRNLVPVISDLSELSDVVKNVSKRCF